MGYGATSAPTIQTGNPQWDRNLGGLAHIFGTPGGYERGLAAGAQAREALLKGDQTISERNAAIALYNAQRGLDETGQPQMPAAPTYRPSGVVGGAPIMEQPPGLVSSSGAPTGPPPSVAPQQPSLWDRIIGRTPSQQAPPAASPAPNAGAPAAPNTTASDGSVPATGEPPNHTVNTTGGGRQYAPAANPDGSPRPPPLNLNTIIGLAMMAGQNAQQAQLTGEALIAGGFEHGIIPWHTANSAMGGQGQSATQLAALIGNNAPYQSVQGTIQNAATNATTIQREQIQQGGETGREGMRLGQQESQFRRTPQVAATTAGPDGGPQVMYPPAAPGQQAVPGGPGFSEQLTQQQRTLDNLQVPYTTAGGGKALTTYGEYKKNPTAYNVLPKDLDELKTAVLAATVAGGGTDAATRLRAGTAAATVPAATDTKTGLYQTYAMDQSAQRRYAALRDKWAGITSGSRDEPPRYSADVHTDILARANDIVRDPKSPAYNNEPLALDLAQEDLIKAGILPDDKNLDRGWTGLLGANPNIAKTDKGGVFVINRLKPGGYTPGAIGTAPSGGKDNQLVDIGGGKKGVIRNGFVYPYQ